MPKYPMFTRKENKYYQINSNSYIVVEDNDKDPSIRAEKNDEYGRIDTQRAALEWFRPIERVDFLNAFNDVASRISDQIHRNEDCPSSWPEAEHHGQS